jgi:hypothetical protein
MMVSYFFGFYIVIFQFFHQGHRPNFITGVTKLQSLASKELKVRLLITEVQT